ncbi:MAG: Mur ligase family protein, partial [Bacteroidota bacterium]
SWDHINVFETEEKYNQQFQVLLDGVEKAGAIIYNKEDALLAEMAERMSEDESLYVHEFNTPSYEISQEGYLIELEGEKKLVKVIGKHNMQNICAAWKVCQLVGIEIDDFLDFISDFQGASSRLQLIHENGKQIIYKDFAHAPAKVEATVKAVREKYEDHTLVACVELHTFSSLNHKFLPHYKSTLDSADHKIVFVDPHATEKRKMKPIEHQDLINAFDDPSLVYVKNKEDLLGALQKLDNGKEILLMMSSGNFGGLNWEDLKK